MQFQKLVSLAELEQHAAGISHANLLTLSSSLHTVDALKQAWSQVKDIVASVASGISEISSSIAAAIQLDIQEIFSFDAALQAAAPGSLGNLCERWAKVKPFLGFILKWFPASVVAVVQVLANLADALCPVAP